MSSNCFRFENIAIEVESVEGDCNVGFHTGDRFSLEALIPKGLCPFLYHTALPYLAAIEHEALFSLPENNFIIVQCPNPTVGVAAKIHQTGKDPCIEVVSIRTKKSDCPYFQFKIGDNWIISKGETRFCSRAYDSLFPYLNALSSEIRTDGIDKDMLAVTCPSYPNFVTFRVERL